MSNGLFVWSNGTADYRPAVLHAFHRSTISRASNRRQRAACGQVFAPRIAFTPSAAPESARCGNCRLVINDYAAPPEPPREPRKPGDPTADHFAVYASGRLIRWRDGSISQGARALCDAVLFDPPYSPRQIVEVYKRVGLPVGMKDTQNARLYSETRNLLTPLLKPGGLALSFGWNSGGFGESRGFRLIEILLVCHGAAHNDTICTVEVKS